MPLHENRDQSSPATKRNAAHSSGRPEGWELGEVLEPIGRDGASRHHYDTDGRSCATVEDEARAGYTLKRK